MLRSSRQGIARERLATRWLPLSTCLATVAATAAPPPRMADPRAFWSRSEYGRDFAVPDPSPSAPSGRRLVPVTSEYRLAVYLGFDGVTLIQGGNDARENRTELIGTPTYEVPPLSWARFGGREAGMKNTVDELKLLLGDYAVQFVTTRPADGDYTMAVIGGKGENILSSSATAVGVAPLDCKNQNPNDLAIVFGGRVDSSEELAYVIAHELGHTFGLEHVADPRDIMYEALNAETCCWTDSPLAEGGSCGRERQDAKKVLLDNLGAGPGDTIPPLVWVIRPGDGAILPPDFSFEIGSADDLRVHHVELFVDGEKRAELSRPPFVVPLLDLAEGEHVLRADAFDFKPNRASAAVTITVSARCPQLGECYFGAAPVGASCGSGSDCSSKICAKMEDRGVCAIPCSGEQGSCPSGTACHEEGSEWICTAGSGWSLDRGSTGCSVGAGPVAEPLGLALLLSVLALARGRGGKPAHGSSRPLGGFRI